MEKVLKLLLIILLLPAALYAQNKGELAYIQKQARDKEAQLKKIKQQEQKLAKEIATLTEKEKTAQRLAKRLSGDLQYLQTLQRQARRHKEVLDGSLPLWREILKTETYALAHQYAPQPSYYGSVQMERDLLVASLINQHALFFAQINDDSKNTEGKLQKYQDQNQQVAQQKDQAQKQHETLQTDHVKKQKDLAKARSEYEKAQEDLRKLKESADKMQKILDTAERKRKAAEQKKGTVSSKAAIKIPVHSLPWPAEGKLISKFGKEYNAQLKTWIFRDGIKIAASKGEQVKASAEGNIIFAGEFRSYGNVVILDHGGGFFTIYGFLSQIHASEGKKAQRGEVLGLAGTDTQGASMGSGKSAVYFEIRSGTTAVDPLDWLVIK